MHPIAAFLSLICLGMAISVHFYGPSHSPLFFLVLFIVLFLTFLVTLLAFLVDILVFVPHVGWGGWIVLVSTVLLGIAGIFTCAMRRMLVSRQATTRRLEEDNSYIPDNYIHKEPVKEDYKSQATYAPSSPGASGNGRSNSMELNPLATDDDRQLLKPMKSSPPPRLNHSPATVPAGYSHSTGNSQHTPSSPSGSSYSTATTQLTSGRVPPNMPYTGPAPAPAMNPPFPIAGLYPHGTGVGEPPMRPAAAGGPNRMAAGGYMGRGIPPPQMRSSPGPRQQQPAVRNPINDHAYMNNGSNPRFSGVPIPVAAAPYGPGRGTPPPRGPPGYNHQNLEMQLSMAGPEMGAARSLTPGSDSSNYSNNSSAHVSNVPLATNSKRPGSTFNVSE